MHIFDQIIQVDKQTASTGNNTQENKKKQSQEIVTIKTMKKGKVV